MDPSIGILLAALAVCVALSAVFSASETAYSAVNKVRLRTMGSEGNKKASAALLLAEDYDRLLTTILVGNNLVNIAGTSIATVLFTLWIGQMGATVSTVVMTVLVLLLGEVSPKTLAKESPEKVAMSVAPFIRLCMVIFLPLNVLFVRWKQLLQKFFKPAEEENFIEEELITMVDEAQSDGDMDVHEGDLIRSAIEFNDRDLTGILTPRVDVAALEDTDTMDAAAALFRESGYSRLPVYHEDMDHVVGILHEKDFYSAREAGRTDFKPFMLKPTMVPATLQISRLLKQFQTTKTHMVIVVDEFGGTEGIVTMEDILEELVGEIYDEHDDVSIDIREEEGGTLSVDGSLPLDELFERFGLENAYESDTVGGWAAEVLGCIPEPGSRFHTEQLEGEVIEMDKLRVTRVRVRAIETTEEENNHGR